MKIDYKRLICGFLWGFLLTSLLTGCVYTSCPQPTPKPIHIDETLDIFHEAYA